MNSPTPLRALLSANPDVEAAIRHAEARAARPTSTEPTAGPAARTAPCRCQGRPVRQGELGPVYCACEAGRAARARYERALASGGAAGVPGLPPVEAGVPPRLAACSMASAEHLFRLGPRATAARAAAYEAAEAFVAAVAAGERPRDGLALFGPVGVGKSGLLAAVTHALQGAGVPVLWIDYAALYQGVQAAYGTAFDGALLLRAQRCPVLVLDDLGDPFRARGDVQETEDRRRIVYQVLAARVAHLRPTLVSANYASLRELSEQFDPRIADRLREAGLVLAVDGRSLRTRDGGARDDAEAPR